MIPSQINLPTDDTAFFHASYHGGDTIPHVPVHLIFWGPEWPNPPSGPSANEVVDKVQILLNGPYLSGLAQYGVGLGSLVGHDFLPTDPGQPVTKGQWHQAIWDFSITPQIGVLHMLVLPPNYQFEDPHVGGAHTSLNSVTTVAFGPVWAGFVLGSTDVNSVTKALFHEILEAATDPNDDGWTLDGRVGPLSEIGDVCVCAAGTVDGIGVQGYWSNFDNACVIPILFSVRRFMRMRGLDPTLGVKVSKPPLISVRTWITG